MYPEHKELPQQGIIAAHQTFQASEDPELGRRFLLVTSCALSSTSITIYWTKGGYGALCYVFCTHLLNGTTLSLLSYILRKTMLMIILNNKKQTHLYSFMNSIEFHLT